MNARHLIRLAVATALLAGCASTNPTPSPSATGAADTGAPVTPAPATPTPPSSASPSPSATSAPTTSSPTLAGGWRPVPVQASVQGVQYEHVIWTGSRFVATGTALNGGGVFLDSDDGVTWDEQAPMADAVPVALAVGPHGIVAVGKIGDRLASWTSADGLIWKSRAGAFPIPTSVPEVVAVTSVVAMGDGWLAVGRRDAICTLDCGLTPLGAMAWTSADGLRWTRVVDQPAFSKAAMMSVTRLGSTFVAVGYAVRRGVIWTSTNGTTWARVPDAPMFHPRSSKANAWIQMIGVTAGNGLVAIGMDAETLCQDVCGLSIRAWWSSDGKTWAKASSADFLGGQALDVTATSTGYLLAGSSGSQSCVGGIWASRDGRTWHCAATDPGFQGFGAVAVAGAPSVEVTVGIVDNPTTSNGPPGAVWWRPVP